MAALLVSGVVSVRAQGTAFSYQGRLRDNTVPAVGVFDLRFTLYDAATYGDQIGPAVKVDDLAVTNGLFCVTLDFGVNAFTGEQRWLETSLRPGSDVGDYTPLTPRRPLTATPYAIYAGTATSVPAGNLTGTVPLARLPGEVVTNHEADLTLSGTFSGDGAGLMSVNAELLDGQPGAFYQNAANLSTGTLPDARLSANVAFLNANQAFRGSNMFAGPTLFAGPSWMTNPDNLLVGVHGGDGANLSNLTAAHLIGTAPKAAAFTGTLVGDVTGTQSSTVVALVGGVTAVDVASGANAANGATTANVPNTIVKRDNTGSFAANVAGTFSGDGSGLTNIPASSIVGTGGGGGTLLLPSGITLASLLPNDANLLASGCALMMTVPAPPWVTSAAVGPASARFGHSAVWDGKRLIVWGGRPVQGSVYLYTGASYVAETDQWESVSTIDAPVARWGHTAVWTGTEMLIWGGNAASGRQNTGGRFQPDRQLWRPISITDAPSPRTEHIAVWTGTQMLIWGGQNALGILNDGGVYAPDADRWSRVVTEAAPTARVGATAVWADNRVLIWGGEGENGVLNSGSQLRFDTSTRYWFAMASNNAPSPRRGHSAIWTGAKMIVWGGQRDGVPLGDGAAYDPATDSWEILSVTGAPAARFDHAAAWTGQEMLILGGSSGSGEFSTGTAYDPLTGVWRPLSTSGNPLARTEATAIWAGTEVLVFGGRARGLAVAPLQRLVPQPVWYFYRKL
jgi:N-acetylneuraminic acid mutarotase